VRRSENRTEHEFGTVCGYPLGHRLTSSVDLVGDFHVDLIGLVYLRCVNQGSVMPTEKTPVSLLTVFVVTILLSRHSSCYDPKGPMHVFDLPLPDIGGSPASNR
jgi:hypothetical protein